MVELENLLMTALRRMEQQQSDRYDELNSQLKSLNEQLHYFVEIVNRLSLELQELEEGLEGQDD